MRCCSFNGGKGIRILSKALEERKKLGVVLCGAFLGSDWSQSERTCANQG